MKKLFIIFFILQLLIQIPCDAALRHRPHDLGNQIKEDEYPESKDVEPKVSQEEVTVIKGGVENSLDITLEDCLKFALGNNPRIQAAMQEYAAQLQEQEKVQQNSPDNKETEKVQKSSETDRNQELKATVANATSSQIMADYMKYYHLLM